MKPYFASILFALSMIGLTAHAADDDEIIEFQGDRYVIHVDKMNPDSEMTLLDVLNTCPEFLSINGKKIDQNYKFRADNIGLVVDPQSFLANVKACEIDRIQICSNTSVAKAVNGTKGVIDIYYRKDVKTDGKVALSGSTYGNGMLYADVADRSEKLTVQTYAMVRSSYGKAYPNDVYKMTDRTLAENLYLSLDWRMSASDRLIIKAYQKFFNSKQKLFNPEMIEALHTPIFTPDLWLMIGSEMDYENTWYINQKREQYLKTDFYVQLDYKHGPWILSIGDRLRLMNFWNRQYNSEDQSTWSHERHNHSYLASVGYKTGRHFFQALFSRRFFVPEINDFLVDETVPMMPPRFDPGAYSTNITHQAVVRYSYQKKDFVFHTSLQGDWDSHLPGPDRTQLGFRNSVYWKTGPWELTLGANYYHQHRKSDAVTASDNDNFFTLKLAPVLNLPNGFRLSSTLLYSSRRTMDNQHAHLFATVKANKQLGRKCNVFAEFHDLAGYVTGFSQQLFDLYQNRALTIGATVYPFRR